MPTNIAPSDAKFSHSAPRPKPPARRSWILRTVLGVVLIVILAGAALWMATGFGLLHLMGMLHGPRTQFNVDQPTVVRQIQLLQRLETVSYTMDKIISGEHDTSYLPKFLVGDRLLLVVPRRSARQSPRQRRGAPTDRVQPETGCARQDALE